jgi:CubicO group peptidase (beta-lactamase class C family)
MDNRDDQAEAAPRGGRTMTGTGTMESVERFVTGQLAAWEVPGCAIAVVRDGDVVLAAGWGRRDLETGLPVTPGTLFAIGSVTKAFTAATVGALVDDGLLEWERPLRDYVSDVRLHDGCAGPTPWARSRS